MIRNMKVTRIDIYQFQNFFSFVNVLLKNKCDEL